MLIMSTSPSLRRKLVDDLRADFKLTDQGTLGDIVHIHVRHNPDKSITIHQEPYINKLVATFYKEGAEAATIKHTNPASKDLPKLVE